MEATIYTISKIIETRDPYTAGHQNIVSQFAVAIAQEMKLPEDKIEGMRIAALVHDIGKISIPAEILSKPSKLNEMEFSLIKNHPKTGYDILKTIDFPWPVAKIVLQHHEKIDGSGYPQGLKGEKILLEAKIMAVADVVEAMFSHRPYRPSLGIDKALKEISQNKGILYDPEVVHACLKLFKEKEFKFESWQHGVPW
jgi:putative nucleotidyltransferase with HDIG domain